MAFACPNCAVAMTASSTRGLWVHRCQSCGGIWLDRIAAEHVRTKFDAEIARLAGEADAHGSGVVREGARACPACRGRLGTFQHEGLTLDGCAAHGIFFDKNELRALLGQRPGAVAVSAQAGDSEPPPSSGTDWVDVGGVALGALAFFLDD